MKPARLFAPALLLLPALTASPARAQEPAPNPNPPLAGLATDVTRRANLEGRVLWMDATANLQRLSSREGLSAVFDKCRKANINTVVVDVKPLSGHVLYQSSIAPRLKEWRGFQYPQDFDFLLTAVLEGRRRGIKVYASLNTFCQGHKLVKSGPLYNELKDQQAIVYDVRRTVIAADGSERDLAVGENRPPADGEVIAYTRPEGKRLSPEEAAAVVSGDRVTAVLDGSLADQGLLPVPPEGHLLVGRGEGAAWLLEHLRVGEALTYRARELLQPILDSPSELVGGFVNPANPASRAYALKVVEELVDRYSLDGVVFDRMRYSSLRTDFSPLSRELFEKWLGKTLDRFPQDIYEYDPVPGKPLIRGPYFKEWLEWRARTISDWLAEAVETVKRRRAGVNVAVYVGSWYQDYYGVGVNWGSPDFSPGYDWMTAGYPATGYAPKLSWIATGCYYAVATRDDARQLGVAVEDTVEDAAQRSVRAVNDASFVYAGLQLLDYKDRPEDFRKALQTALQNSQGVMLFDLVYLEEYNWWNILSEVFTTPRRAPHDVPGLLSALQQAKKALQPLSLRPSASEASSLAPR